MKFDLRDRSGDLPPRPSVVIDLDRGTRVPGVFRLDTEAGECECYVSDDQGAFRLGPDGRTVLTEVRRGRFGLYPVPAGQSVAGLLRDHPELLTPGT